MNSLDLGHGGLDLGHDYVRACAGLSHVGLDLGHGWPRFGAWMA